MNQSTLSRKAEDYLEGILISVNEKGYARPRDVVKRMEVSYPSATEMLRKLAEQKLITYEKYGEIKLTSEGLSIASKIKNRHDVFENFLKIILIKNEIAEKDACVLEHHLHPETIRQFSKFVSFIKESRKRPEFLIEFEKYCKK
ncbi:MAG: metal-dependent transcriptional regulator [Candidatus Micrarchaeota archaeon]|nr:metal-dependent transcriptional regulator [Candidatus Micrarchaeota archaeon]